MLVLDPSKRLTIAQIKEHKWMLIEVPAQRPILYPPGEENEPSIGEYNEQVLRLMHSLGIDQQKTVEVNSNRHLSLGGRFPGLFLSLEFITRVACNILYFNSWW